MNFAFTDEQAMIAETARAFFAAEATSERTRAAMAQPDGTDAGLWRAFADTLGLAGVMVPEALGGAGLGAVELAILAEAAGAQVAALPLIASLGMAIPAILAGGDAAQRGDLLPALASGTARATFAQGAFRRDGATISGEASFVPHAATCDLLLLAGADGVAVVRAGAPGLTVHTGVTMDQTRPLSKVTANAAVCLWLADGVAATQAAHRIGTLAVAADALGGAQACLDRTVAYTQERVQFGRPIGSFQAVKHRLADLTVAIEQARSAVWWAACAIDEDDAEAALATHAAKAAACDAYSDAAAAMIQLHGGIGFTWEHDAHLFFKRARADSSLLGTPAWHREQIARLIGLDRAA